MGPGHQYTMVGHRPATQYDGTTVEASFHVFLPDDLKRTPRTHD